MDAKWRIKKNHAKFRLKNEDLDIFEVFFPNKNNFLKENGDKN